MITIPVGKTEKHTVTFSYDTMWGKMQILVDGKEYSSSRVIIVGHTPFILQVGDKEKHNVRIELNNQLGFAIRGSDVKVFVDEELVQQTKVGGNTIVLFMIIGFVLLMFFLISFYAWLLFKP